MNISSYTVSPNKSERGILQGNTHFNGSLAHNILCIYFCIFIEKNPCINGPMQFKSMLFKGQLYILCKSSIVGWFPLETVSKIEIRVHSGNAFGITTYG